MRYLTSCPSDVLSISYHDLCFTKLEISWQVQVSTSRYSKKSQESHLSTEIGSHLFFEDVLVDWVSSFFSFQLLARDTLCVFAAPIQGESTRCLPYRVSIEPKLYIPSTLNTDYLLWYTQLIVRSSKISNHGLNQWLLFSIFKFFGWKNMKKKLEKSGLKSTLFDTSVLLDVHIVHCTG